MFAASHGVILGPILWRARINDPYGSLLTQDILWCNNSNIVLLHVYIKYMEVSNLSSHTIADVYFKKLSLRIASYTDQLFFFSLFLFCHITYVFQWPWTTAKKFIWNYSLWPEYILTYMHFIQPLASSPHFLPPAVKIWWTLLLPFTAGTCRASGAVNETEPELTVPPGGHTTPCLSAFTYLWASLFLQESYTEAFLVCNWAASHYKPIDCH